MFNRTRGCAEFAIGAPGTLVFLGYVAFEGAAQMT